MITQKNYAGKIANAITDIRPLGEAVESAGKLLIAVGATALSIITLGTKAEINKKANDTSSYRQILKKPYQYLLRIVNPDYRLTQTTSGLFSKTFILPLRPFFDAQGNSKSFFVKQISLRVFSLIALPVIIIASIADNALGLIAAAFSIFPCFGKVKEINNFANQQLNFTFGLALLAVRVVVNPSQIW